MTALTKEIEDKTSISESRITNFSIGSNKFESILDVIRIGGNSLFYFEHGQTPLVTINIMIGKDNWVKLVDRNSSSSDSIIVYKDERKRLTEVRIGDTEILSAIIRVNKFVIVDHLDFRPIGFNIWLDNDSLKIGNTTLSNNTFSNFDVAIRMDDN